MRALGSALALSLLFGAVADRARADESPPPKPATSAAAPIRPAPFAEDLPAPELHRVPRLEVTLSALAISMPAADKSLGHPAQVAYLPTAGMELDLRLPIHRYFQAGTFFAGGLHHISFAGNALGIHGSIDSDLLKTFWLGARAMPMLPIGDYVRLYASVGAAWGRFNFPQMNANEPGAGSFVIKSRANSFLQFPIGVGASFTVIRHWLAVDVNLTGAPVFNEDGTSYVSAQVIQAGRVKEVGPLAKVSGIFVQSLGLSLLL